MDMNYPLSNIQIELLKLFSTNLSDKDLKELRTLLSQFYARKAIKAADETWDNRGLSDDDMEKWLNGQS